MRRKRAAASLSAAGSSPEASAMRRLRLRLPFLLLLPVTVAILILLSRRVRSPAAPRPPTPPPAAGCPPRAPRPAPPPLYAASCPFHRNSYNCLRNGRPPLAALSWAPARCGGAVVPRIDAAGFLAAARGRRVGLVGDSLSENLAVALLCALCSADPGARKWKRRGAWRGGYFPREDVTVAFRRAVLLAKYTWGTYKFPKETPLVFYRGGEPIEPPLSIPDGLKVVIRSMASYIDREMPSKTLKLWRTQSPRHFYGDEWDHNGSCVTDRLLEEDELESWFDPRFGGVNKDARTVNLAIQEALAGSGFRLVNLTYMSEFRADAHPATWLGKKDAVAVYGQDCMHWCVPGVPDTWVDILAAQILHYFKQGKG
ncbi:protein trichome birefringence-like 12 [Panicum miliaceum]|uniref:Protein trichome birefringence-like 12 n=1 Tax=Panicum miliaceum TaxID=4540 RepID=A0A3L6QLC9_PANMI|nr:protein trichome birefringence-like 12 [Panicum miliaceum]